MRWYYQSSVERMTVSLLHSIFGPNITSQPRTPAHPNTFSHGRCLLLLRFLLLLAVGATLFQAALFVLRYYPSELLILYILLFSSVPFLIGALLDLLRILKLRSEAKRI